MSSGVWQADRTSTLVYRSQFGSHAADLRDQAVEQFTQWLRSKDVGTTSFALLSGAAAEATASDGSRRVATGTWGTWEEPKTGRRLDALRLRLEENLSDGGAWITRPPARCRRRRAVSWRSSRGRSGIWTAW